MSEPITSPNSNSNTSGGTDSNPGSASKEGASVSVSPQPPNVSSANPDSTNTAFISDTGLEVSDALSTDGKPLTPAEDKTLPGINYDAFQDMLSGQAPIPINEKPKVEEKKDEKSREKTEAAPDSKLPEPELPQQQDKTETPSQPNKEDKYASRDLTDVPEPLHKFFKRNMSLEAFNAVKPYVVNLTKELKATKEENEALKQGVVKIPESYYENPESIKLTPKYQETLQAVKLATDVHQHCKQQVIRMSRGEKWQDLGTNDKGEIVVLPEKVGTAEDLEEVRENMQKVLLLKNTKEQELQSIQSGFKAKHSEAVKVIDDVVKQHFAAFQDEKSPMKPVIERIKAMLPETFRNSPLATLAIYSLAANLAQQDKIQKLEKAQNKTTTIANVVRNAGPTENAASGSANGNGVPKIASYDAILDRMKSA